MFSKDQAGNVSFCLNVPMNVKTLMQCNMTKAREKEKCGETSSWLNVYGSDEDEYEGIEVQKRKRQKKEI